MSDPTTREQSCPSCGVPWSSHLGVAGTCRDLAAMKAQNAVLMEQIAKLEEERKDLQLLVEEAGFARRMAHQKASRDGLTGS